jgi:hypothetical protein
MKQPYFKNHLGKLCGFLPLIFLGFSVNPILGQESLNTSGGDASNVNGSVSYSVGQVFYSNPNDLNASLSEGVQYAIELQSLSDSSFKFELEVKIYPNPSTSFVNLQTKEQNANLHYELYDLMGRLVIQNEITTPKTIIDVGSLNNATYQLNILSANRKILKTFKIIKN